MRRTKTKYARGYARESTQKQGINGLGIKAQTRIIKNRASELDLELIEICKEVESGRKMTLARPILKKAFEDCKEDGAILIVAKMDRLTRNSRFLSQMADAIERMGITIIACDVPMLSDPIQTEFIWRIMAATAEFEAKQTARRTAVAMAEIKEEIKETGRHVTDRGRGRTIKKLGNPNLGEAQKKGAAKMKRDTEKFAEKVFPVIQELESGGLTSLRKIADGLNKRGIKTYQAELIEMEVSDINKRKTQKIPLWSAEAVRRIKKRMEEK